MNPHMSNDLAIIAASTGGHAESVQFLMDIGLDPSVDGNRALRHALILGNTAVVELLLKESRINYNPMDLLKIALMSRNLDTVKALMNIPEAKNSIVQVAAALQYARFHDLEDITQYLERFIKNNLYTNGRIFQKSRPPI